MLGQAIRFGLVGVLATSVHLLSGAMLILSGCPPLWANVVSFLIAFSVSFIGHFRFSFADQQCDLSVAIKRFSCVALVGFFLNFTLFAVLLSQTRVDAVLALVLTTGLAAGVTFFLSRGWAFRLPTVRRDVSLERSP